jgi:hypothetical protein
MILVGLFGALFTIFAAGFGVTMSIFARSDRINVLECACLAWLLGSGIVSLFLWIGGLVCSGIALHAIVTIGCVALAALGWRAKQNLKFHVPKPATLIEWILAGVVVVQVVILFLVAFKHTLGWDGLLNWEIKARYAFLSGGVIPGSYYSSAGRAFSHPEYPLGIPNTELWLYLWMGEPNQFWVKIIFPLFYAAGAGLLTLLSARLTGKRWLGLLAGALLAFVPSICASPGGIVVGYVDVPLGVMYLAAIGYLLCWFQRDHRHAIVVFAACSALLPWIKSEGVVLWLVSGILGLGLALLKRRSAQVALAMLPGLAITIGWRIYLKFAHLWPHSDFFRPTLVVLRENIGRLGEICRLLFEEVRETAHWSIFWLLAAIAIAYLIASRKAERILVALLVLGPVLLYSLTFLFSNWPSYTAHITSSLPRLLLHVMPAGWLAIALALSESKAPRSI